MASYHILVPLDLSAYADHVLDYLLTFINMLTTRSGTFQTQVTLLHVIATPNLPGIVEHAVLDLRQPEAWARRKLEQDYAPRLRDTGVLCNTSLVHGVPAQVITELARNSQVNMIMMGTHGHSGIPHMMLGSVADKVLRLAPCPVMVVRPPGQEPA
jgi:nucleotide-binding universal stress UspA family protein